MALSFLQKTNVIVMLVLAIRRDQDKFEADLGVRKALAAFY